MEETAAGRPATGHFPSDQFCSASSSNNTDNGNSPSKETNDMKITKTFATCLMAFGVSALAIPPPAQAQVQQPRTTMAVEPMDQTPTFHVNVVSRTVPAVNYRHRSGATKLGFKGTDLMPGAHAEAKVESKKGYTEIEVEFHGLDNPTSFGGEYLTYVLWAITPEGRPTNLGEILVTSDHSSKLDVTTDMQAFALIVTAEPYFAVRQPSNVVVVENVIREDTMGKVETVNAKYDLLERGGYIPTGFKFDPVVLNAKLPLEFFEARNALRIAKSAGAEQYASSSYQHAVQLMTQADGYATRKNIEKKPLIGASREAVQTAEDAREISVKRMAKERLDADSLASANREADAKAATKSAEAETAEANRARAEAERQKRESEAAALQAQNAASAEAERNRAAAAAAAASADEQLQQALREKKDLRAQLLQQFNSILQTRDTARGLVVNMSDVLFDSGKNTLRPIAREKLAKISGIMLAYPGLKLGIEGNTDSVGGDAYNQDLSQKRANSVQSYLAEQGIPSGSMTSVGFGKTQPVASNDTAGGRQLNRRVELVVSGEVIGTTIGSVTAPTSSVVAGTTPR
jgi:outer membrane protein OmpA-like peptidoglycan-associated protein